MRFNFFYLIACSIELARGGGGINWEPLAEIDMQHTLEWSEVKTNSRRDCDCVECSLTRVHRLTRGCTIFASRKCHGLPGCARACGCSDECSRHRLQRSRAGCSCRGADRMWTRVWTSREARSLLGHEGSAWDSASCSAVWSWCWFGFGCWCWCGECSWTGCSCLLLQLQL